MAGVTGRTVKAAYAVTNTWGTPASVTKQVLLTDTSGLDSSVQLVDNEDFNQSFLAEAEAGDHAPITPSLPMQLRYEDCDVWLAAAMGSPATPTVVSSVAANSLVAYSHQIDLAPEVEGVMYTLAVDYGQYVSEVPSMRVRGYEIRVGDNGRMLVNFPVVGAKVNYDSTVNINSTVAGATAPSTNHRVFRKQGVLRMNVQGAAGLAAADKIDIAKEVMFSSGREVAQDDHVFGQDYIIYPDDNGFPEFPLEVTYARMNTVSANSLAIAISAATAFKADLTFTGLYINSTTQRSLTFEFPALQLYSFRAPAAGGGQVKPVAVFRAKRAASAPTGMTVTDPVRLTVVNANSATLV